MQPSLENPFRAMNEAVARMREETSIIFVDVHAETTSEKVAMGRFLDGRVSAVVGTHTHVQTADEQVFPGGTAFLCDAGCCGPSESCLGRDYDAIIHRFMTSLPVPFPIARGEVQLHGAIVEVDPGTGHARSIRRLVERYGPSLAVVPTATATQTAPVATERLIDRCSRESSRIARNCHHSDRHPFSKGVCVPIFRPRVHTARFSTLVFRRTLIPQTKSASHRSDESLPFG